MAGEKNSKQVLFITKSVSYWYHINTNPYTYNFFIGFIKIFFLCQFIVTFFVDLTPLQVEPGKIDILFYLIAEHKEYENNMSK